MKQKIRQLNRPADGSSQPWFCTMEDGSEWVVKFAGAGPGVEALVAELVANALGRHWGFPIPETRPLFLSKTVPKAGTDEFWDVLRESRGWNLGIRVVANAKVLEPDLSLPHTMLESLAFFDAFTRNQDRTQASQNLLSDSAERVWWIDHGSCRFLHHLDGDAMPTLPAGHFLSQAGFDGALMAPPSMPNEAVREVIAGIPDPWVAASPWKRADLFGGLKARLEKMGAP
jgi:hypothetical protein